MDILGGSGKLALLAANLRTAAKLTCPTPVYCRAGREDFRHVYDVAEDSVLGKRRYQAKANEVSASSAQRASLEAELRHQGSLSVRHDGKVVFHSLQLKKHKCLVCQPKWPKCTEK